MENKILYQIKSLEKEIVRTHLCNIECSINLEKMPTPTQMQIIDYIIKHNNEEIYQKDLEKILNLTRATVSGVLQTMEKNNLIERTSYEDDARTKKIILTEKANSLFKQGEEKMLEIEKTIIKNIDKKDLEIFSKVIQEMKINLKNIREGE